MAEQSTMAAGTARLSCHAVEHMIREIWRDYFGRDVSSYDDFFELGGDSLAIIDVVGKARELGLPVRSSVALRNPSPARLAEALTVGVDSGPVSLPALCAGPGRAAPLAPRPEPIVVTGSGEPLHVVHSDSHVEVERAAVASWESPRPVTGLSLTAGSGGGLVDRLLAALLRAQPEGPYRLAGFGHGAVPAFDLAVLLRRRGAAVPLLAMIDPPAVGVPGESTRESLHQRRMTMLARRFGLSGAESLEEIHARMRRDGWYGHLNPRDLPASQSSFVDLELAARAYEPARYDGPALLVTGGTDPSVWQRAIADLDLHWLDHRIESPAAVLHDEELALVMRKALHR